MHAEMTAPLRQSLSEASQSDPGLTAELALLRGQPVRSRPSRLCRSISDRPPHTP